MARREVFPDEDPVRDIPPLDLSAQGMANRPKEVIEAVEKMPEVDYMDALKFDRDVLTVMLESPAREDQGDQPAMAYDFSVGRETRTVPIGIEVKIERMFVEVIGRARTGQVSLRSAIANDPRSRNELRRTHIKRFPLTVLHDPSPKGRDWWRKISMES